MASDEIGGKAGEVEEERWLWYDDAGEGGNMGDLLYELAGLAAADWGVLEDSEGMMEIGGGTILDWV